MPPLPTFGLVTNLVAEQLQQNGIDVDPTKAVLAMTTRLGEVAGFCGDKFISSGNNNNNNSHLVGSSRGPSPNPQPSWASLNAKEHATLKALLGDLGVALFAVATATGIDLGEAVMNSLGVPINNNNNNAASSGVNNNNNTNNQNQQISNLQNNNNQNQNQNNNQRSQSSVNTNYGSMPPFHNAMSQSQPASLRPVAATINDNNNNNNFYQNNNNNINNNNTQLVQAAAIADVTLNPHSVSNITQFIASIRQQTQPLNDDEFAHIGMVFAYEDANNQKNGLIPLVPNGAKIPVNSSNFDSFTRLFFDNLNNANNNNNYAISHQTPTRVNGGVGAAGISHLSQEALEQHRQQYNGNENNNNVAAVDNGLTSPGGFRGRIPSQQNQNQNQHQSAFERRNPSQTGENNNNNNNGSTSRFEGEVVGHEDGAVIRRIKVDRTGHPDLAHELACYSPSHNNFGLFSPPAKGDTIDVAYPEDSPVAQGQSGPTQQQMYQQQQYYANTSTQNQNNNNNINNNDNGNNNNDQGFGAQTGQNFGLGSPQAPATSTLAFPSNFSLPESQSQSQQRQREQIQQQQPSGDNNNNTTTNNTTNNSNVPSTAISRTYSPQIQQIVNNSNNLNNNGGATAFAAADSLQVAASDDLFNTRFTHLERLVLDVEEQLAAIGKNAGAIRQIIPSLLSKDEIAALSLVFAIPFKGKYHPLTDGGEWIAVTPQNAKEYITLVRDQRAIFDGRLSKKQSVKTLAVHLPHGGDPGRDEFQTHTRAGDLTAPPDTKATFTFDTENDENLVPKVLQRDKLPTLLPSPAHYVAFLSSHPERFPEMFKVMKQRPDMLSRWNVSYAVPDPESEPPHSLSHATEHSARRCGVRELFPGGASKNVLEADLDDFISRVLAVSPQLPTCLRP